ncbi:hypothetical protein [Mesorhizobium humile]|uniref:hypothetical protein n=1 Tax=Mesorhizobium humile TaxID=3072313 RepID=UPI002A245677|nr:hypothetical protein [Mesorhizobium sp. VK2D]MDX8461093.1 hypothetical protein [Mesorhizobium sp. VK2D]
MALGELDHIAIAGLDEFACLDLALSRHLRLALPGLLNFRRVSNDVENHGNSAFHHFILNVRSINIAEIALDFNRRMRSSLKKAGKPKEPRAPRIKWERAVGVSEWEGRMAGQSEPATEITPGALQ